MPLKIEKRGKIWWYFGTVAGRRLRKSTGTQDRKTAERIASEAEAKAWKRRLDGPGADLTMAQAAILYRKADKPTRFLDRVEDYWRDTLVRDVNAGRVRQGATQVYPNVSGATLNRQFIVPTCAIINHSAELELCAPIKVRRFPVEKKEKKPVDRQWVESFMKEAQPNMAALCLFMYATGARITEAVSLTWDDVELSDATALIRQTKVSAERTAHLPPPLVAAMASIGGNRNPDEKVFGYSSRDTAKPTWNAVVRRAGLPHRSFHACRHGFATDMLRANVDPMTVAKAGGWADVGQLWKTYGHARDDKTVTNALFGTNLTQEAQDQPLTISKTKGKS